ncbi:MAG: HD domain-containing protein [Nitrosopumilaceae archaeon]
MLVDLFNNIINLKNIQRKGWIDKLGVKHPESVADHSYSMTLMAMIISELQGLDTYKIVKMSLLHDLAESKIGDLTPGEISKEKKFKIENNEMNNILEMLPGELEKNYRDVWDEFVLAQSDESIFVHEMDKLEMVFQAKYYMNEGFSKEKIQQFIDTANKEINNKELKELVTKLF